MLDRDKLEITSLHDADTPVVHEGMVPLFTLDVWEHAYYIDYRNERPRFVSTGPVEHRQLGLRRAEPRRPGLDAPTRRRERSTAGDLLLEAIAGPEHPGDDGEADDDEGERHGEARPDGHVGDRIEAPAEAADQVDDRIEQGTARHGSASALIE